MRRMANVPRFGSPAGGARRLLAGAALMALGAAALPAEAQTRDTAVFDRRVGDRVLTFHPIRGGFRDRETGSGWTLAGRAVGGPLKGARLIPIPHGDHFWFAWAVFRPETRVWEP
jgi:hypothetical protein